MQTAQLLAGDGGPIDELGLSVAVSGTTALIGARGHQGFTGAAYVFENESAGWVETQKLEIAGGELGDQFGFAVALRGDTALATSLRQDGALSGLGVLFERTAADFVEAGRLEPFESLALDFGNAAALASDAALIGAFGSQAAHLFKLPGTRGPGSPRASRMPVRSGTPGHPPCTSCRRGAWLRSPNSAAARA